MSSTGRVVEARRGLASWLASWLVRLRRARWQERMPWLQRVRWPRWGGRAADLGLLGLLTWIHLVMCRVLAYAPARFDEQFFLFEGFALGRGQVPYRDFQEFKPPVIFVVNMLALKLFGLHDMRFRHFFTLLSVVSFLAIAVALLSRGVPRLIILALEVLMMNHFLDGTFLDGGVIDTAEAPGVFFFLLALATLLFRTRRVRLQQFVGGALFALVPLSKEPLALPVLMAWLCLMRLHADESDQPRAWLAFAKHTAAGVLMVVISFLGYLTFTRALGWYIVQLRDTMVYAADHNRMYGIFPKLAFWPTWAENWRRLNAKYVNPEHLVAFLAYFAAALLLWKRHRGWMAATVVATFAGGLYAVTIGHGFFGHYFIMAMTGTFFAAVMGAVAMGGQLATLAPSWRRWICVSLSAAALYAILPRFQRQWEQWDSFHPQPPMVSEGFVRFVQQHTGPKDSIWNVGMPAIYFYADRTSGSRIPYVHDSLLHIYAGTTDAERLAPYRQQLDARPPKLIILNGDRAGRERHMDLLITPFIKAHGYRQIGAPVAATVYERPN